jgi:hypothetical protein
MTKFKIGHNDDVHEVIDRISSMLRPYGLEINSGNGDEKGVEYSIDTLPNCPNVEYTD